VALAAGSGGLLLAQNAGKLKQGRVEVVKVHGKSLEGNLEGDSADRDVSIYLPPSYQAERARRYPVIYLLHGFTDDDEHWFGRKPHFISVPAVVDKALAAGAREMIVVMPNAFTAYQGSMYSNSVTTGNWEEFIAKDLVAYVDSHYRTIPEVAGRGLAGHSMGGYGTVRIGMKFPEVFSSIYVLSPCCLTPPAAFQGTRPGAERVEAIVSQAEVAKLDFGTKAQLASAAAWSPNPKKPPLFFDLITKDGQIQPAIAAKWAANAPLSMVDQYVPNLKRLKAIAMDVGAQDGLAGGAKALDQMLNDYGIEHTFEIYEGTHTNHVADRVETKVLPFFSKTLSLGR
jgi:enterochelin esterase-like enzyme